MDGVTYYLRSLRREDVAQVMDIERETFSALWSPAAFRRELENRMVRYLVVVQESQMGPRSSIHLAPVRRPSTFLGWLKQMARTILFRAGMTPKTANGKVVGFVGVWFIADEAHITAIAVGSSFRGQGLGELLLMGTLEMAMRRRAHVVTLEMRVSNTIAQALYEKYRFRSVGVRKGYYTDNKEDALIMTTDPINTLAYQDYFQRMVTQFRERRGEPRVVLA